MQNCSEKRKNHLENLDVHGRITVKLILQKHDRPAVVWTAFSWLRKGPSSGNEAPDSKKGVKFLTS
jgi:hypothetical protein